jgi:hypothetical protein
MTIDAEEGRFVAGTTNKKKKENAESDDQWSVRNFVSAY